MDVSQDIDWIQIIQGIAFCPTFLFLSPMYFYMQWVPAKSSLGELY